MRLTSPRPVRLPYRRRVRLLIVAGRSARRRDDGDVGVQHGRARGRGAPGGLRGVDGLVRALEPDGDPLRRRRARVRRRAGRPDQGLRQRRRPDARRSTPTCARTCTGSGIAGCSAWRSTRFHDRAALRLRALHVRRAGSASSRPTWGDACPTPPGATGDGCVVSGRLSRLNGPVRDGPHQRLVPAVPEPLGRLARVRRRTARSTPRPATARASTSPTTARTAIRSTRAATPGGAEPDAARARRAARCAARTSARRPTRRASTARSSASTPTRARRCRTTRTPASADPNTRRIVAHGFRNPFRFTFRPGHERALRRRRGLEHLGGDQPHPEPGGVRVENFGWPCYEGDGPACRATTTSTSASARTLYTQRHGASPRRCSRTTTRAVVAERELPDRQRRRSPGSRSTTAARFPAEYDGALFFADYSRNCIWVMYPDANGIPDPAPPRSSSTAPPDPVDLQVGPGGDLFYVDLSGGTIRRVHCDAATARRSPRATRQPDERERPADGAIRRHARRAIPTATRSTYAWDLDGDGAYDDATERDAVVHLHDRGHVHGAPARHRPGGLSSTPTPSPITRRRTADADDRHARPPPRRGGSARRSPFAGSADERAGRRAARLGAVLAADPPPLLGARPDELPQAPAADVHRRLRQLHRARPRVPAYLELELDGHATARSPRRPSRRLDPRTVDLTFESAPAGLTLSVGAEAQTTPFTRRVIQGSTVGVIAPTPQTLGGKTLRVQRRWSDGGAARHTFVAPDTPADVPRDLRRGSVPVAHRARRRVGLRRGERRRR